MKKIDEVFVLVLENFSVFFFFFSNRKHRMIVYLIWLAPVHQNPLLDILLIRVGQQRNFSLSFCAEQTFVLSVAMTLRFGFAFHISPASGTMEFLPKPRFDSFDRSKERNGTIILAFSSPNNYYLCFVATCK